MAAAMLKIQTQVLRLGRQTFYPLRHLLRPCHPLPHGGGRGGGGALYLFIVKRQKDGELKDSLGYTLIPCYQKTKKPKQSNPRAGDVAQCKSKALNLSCSVAKQGYQQKDTHSGL